MLPPLPVIAPAVAVPMIAAEAGVDYDPVAILTQLGIGGALVYFAARLWRAFETKRDQLTEQNRDDIANVRREHAAAIADLKAEHAADIAALRVDIAGRDEELRDVRAQLIDALRQSHPAPTTEAPNA